MPSHRLPDGSTPVLLSSDTADGVRAEAAAVLAYLEPRSKVTPDRVADMLFRTRAPRRHRTLAMVRTRDELLVALRAILSGQAHTSVVRSDAPATARRIGFVFPGQGSQWPGMGALYHRTSAAYRRAVDDCVAVHTERYGHARPLRYLLGDEGCYEDKVWEVQPALMFHMYGLAAMWRAAGVLPGATIGHSQGELAAAAVAGVMTLRDAVLAVTHRALLVERIAPSGCSMAVLGMGAEECEDMLARTSGWAELSVVNAPNIVAISGDREAIAEVVAMAIDRGRFAKEIQVAYPAHTTFLHRLRNDFESMLGEEMSSQTFTAGEMTCYGATLGAPITQDLSHRQYWFWNLRNKVRFDRAVVAACTDGIDTLIEIAEHPVLQLALQENAAMAPKPSTGIDRDIRVMGTSRRDATGLSEFTHNLACVAVADLNFRWEALRTELPGETVTLPLRDFPHTRLNQRRLWAVPDDPAPAASDLSVSGPKTGEPAADRPAPQRLTTTWLPVTQRPMNGPRALALVDHTGRGADLASALAAAADRYGAAATVFDRVALAELDGASEPVDYDTAVILLPAGEPGIDMATAVAELTEFFADRVWLPALARLRPGGECRLVTIGGESVIDSDPAPHWVHGSISAGFRSVAIEYPGVLFGHLDLDVGEPGPEQAARVIGALHTASEPELALRGETVYAKRLVPDETTVPLDPAVLDHVLIVGGIGRLGIRFCEYFATSGARRITLLGRSGETREVSARVDPIRRGGTEISVYSADIGDLGSLNRLAGELGGDPVTLLVHAAVDYVDADLARITPRLVAKAAAAKVVGLEAVLATLPRAERCRIVLCSSFAAVMGGRGQILYAVTNRMLDIAALRLRARGEDCVSQQWGLWEVAGPLDEAGFARVSGMGVVPMRPEEAMAVGLTGHRTDAAVIAADWSRVHEVMCAFGQGAIPASLLGRMPFGALSNPPAAVTGPPVGPGSAAVDRRSLTERLLVELEWVMGVEGADLIDRSAPLVSLGLDSLQALDFRKRVQAKLDRDLPVAAILGGASIDDLVSLMVENVA
ncbi:nocobactin polyketide synthase NbtC [Nocardia brevicatena]|uniref:nocobactin polyketide synthase NbtC n=1 Tax=Nocardia brevicatena TaxID=37327 RepID=UPI0003198E32|nr:nocobactin polyketide synthase NbtC [Nocardia brevicatena]